jgi:hypothetical protein
MFESTFSRPIGFFRRFRCKRLKMFGLGRLAGLRAMGKTIRSSMFQYASGAGSRDWQSSPSVSWRRGAPGRSGPTKDGNGVSRE